MVIEEKDSNWECFCGNFVKESFGCNECGLTVIGSGVKKRAAASPDGKDPIDQAIRGMTKSIKGLDFSVSDEENPTD